MGQAVFKKSSSFSSVTDEQLAFIADQLNNRTRRGLGYASPNEIFTKEMNTMQQKSYLHL
jgi:IS30 family transposase